MMNRDPLLSPFHSLPSPSPNRTRVVSTEDGPQPPFGSYQNTRISSETEQHRLYPSSSFQDHSDPMLSREQTNMLLAMELCQQSLLELNDDNPAQDDHDDDKMMMMMMHDENANDMEIMELQDELKVLEAQRQLLDEEIARTRLRLMMMQEHGQGKKYVKAAW